MLVQNARNPGFTIGVNGLAGNLGIALAAVLTGFLVKAVGWRAAFAVPGGLAVLCGLLFLVLVPREDMAPAKRPKKSVDLPPAVMARVILVMTLAAISSSLIFNFTTNGNGQLLTERLRGAGFIVTVVPGRGRDGSVDVLITSVARRHVKAITALVAETDPNAFITVEDVRPVRRRKDEEA